MKPYMIEEAYWRIKKYIVETPIIGQHRLKNIFNEKGNVFLKLDSVQRTGSFKIRGVLNHLLNLKNDNKLPKKIVSYSTGNHAHAIAYAGKIFGIETRLYLPQNVSSIKAEISRSYGADVIIVDSRKDAEEKSKKDGKNGYYYLHPSDNNDIILGAGTLCYEALLQMKKLNVTPDAIFAPCGGGGLLAGSYLAKQLLMPNIKLYGVEPENANDAYRSIKEEKIFKFEDSPNTVADGLRALCVANKTLEFLKKLDDFYLVKEQQILSWTEKLNNILKINTEPSSAICMQAVEDWINQGNVKKNILVLITGGNV